MKMIKPQPPVEIAENNNGLLREKLASNRKKLEAMVIEIREQNRELEQLKAEIAELSKLYNPNTV